MNTKKSNSPILPFQNSDPPPKKKKKIPLYTTELGSVPHSSTVHHDK